MDSQPSFLIIQTAFIGDVILATGLLEKLHAFYPQASIDCMVRKGNEGIVKNHPFIRQVWVWDKKNNKYKNLSGLLKQVRQQNYTYVINLQRYATTGWFTLMAGAKNTIGFDRNPLSRFFSVRIRHSQREGIHETERNHQLISHLTDSIPAKPRLYPSAADFEKVAAYTQLPYICMAPTSVWFTKQYPAERWVELIQKLQDSYLIYLLGGLDDQPICEAIAQQGKAERVQNLAGKLSLLASAALMKNAVMNYVNDSSPMHLASAMNAPVCVMYCSTVPAFGYGPLSDQSFVIETEEILDCRPCGLHGYQACPKGHFHCAYSISTDRIVGVLENG